MLCWQVADINEAKLRGKGSHNGQQIVSQSRHLINNYVINYIATIHTSTAV